MIKKFIEKYWPLMIGLIVLAIGIIGSRCSKPVVVSVERDTVVVYDTIPHYYPVPKDSAVVRYVTRVLPVVRDNVAQYSNRTDTIDHVIDANNLTDHFADASNMIAVEVPITSKHYNAPEYDAWVSGYEPSLDSIKVYQRTEYITERITISKPPNKVALFLDAGVDYTFNDKKWYPHAGGELVLNNHKRIQFAVGGGVMKTPLVNGVNPYAGGKVKIRVF